MGLKIDMSKAYDQLEWSFIERVLKAFGFPTHICTFVMFCIKLVSYSVLLNGSPTPDFKPHRGIRQGDPLSLYIFILCGKILSRLIFKAETNDDLYGIKIARATPSITQLMFADDTCLFC